MNNIAKHIETGLRNVKDKDTDIFVLAVRDCLKKGNNWQDYLDCIPKCILDNLSPAQQAIVESGRESSVITAELDNDNPISMHLAAKYFLSNYKQSEVNGQLTHYKVTSEQDKTLHPVLERDIEKILAREISTRWLEELGVPLPPRRAAELVKYWLNHSELIEAPKIMGLPGDDSWCLHRSQYFPDPNVDFPSWQRILDRLSDPIAFAAWHYGVYTGLYQGRQVLWVQGQHGEEGKSAIARIIGQELYGPAHNAISNASINSNEKRFLNSHFEHAALVIYPDASNRKCLSSEEFKTLASAGSDPVLIERKGKQAYTAYLNARMWVCSNFSPEVTNDHFMTSRLLYITIAPMVGEKPDPSVKERLKAELSGFLAFAKKCYEERCKDNYKIQSDTDNDVKALAEQEFEDFESFFNKYWQVDTESEITASALSSVFRQEGIAETQQQNRFVKWMEKEKGVKKQKRSSERGRTFYIGLKASEGHLLNLDDVIAMEK